MWLQSFSWSLCWKQSSSFHVFRCISPVVVTVGLIERVYILGWSCFLLYIDCLGRVVLRVLTLFFPLKSILVRVFQNHKLRVEIKYMFSWCSERQDLAQIRLILPHSPCQEHYLRFINWLTLIFFKMTLRCFEDMFLHIKWRQARVARRATIQCQILVEQTFIVWGCHGYGSCGFLFSLLKLLASLMVLIWVFLSLLFSYYVG